MLTAEKTKCTNHLAILNDRGVQYMREEYMHESYLAQLREEISSLENGSRLPRLENRISVPYNAEMYSTSSAYSRTSTYIEDYLYPIPEDRSIRPDIGDASSPMVNIAIVATNTMLTENLWSVLFVLICKLFVLFI